MHALPSRSVRVFNNLRQRLQGASLREFNETTLRRISNPSIGMIKECKERIARDLPREDEFSFRLVVAHDAPNSPKTERTIEPSLFNLSSQVTRHEHAMLQDASIQVDDVESTVWTVGQINGTKPLVS
jgi:hypothetical protein